MDTNQTQTSTGSNLLLLEEKIHQILLESQKAQMEYKEQKSMFDDTFNGDAQYKQLDDKAKEATRAKNAARQAIMKQPAVVTLSEKVKEMKENLKDLQTELSDYLHQYQRESGTNQFTSKDGEVLEIVQVMKLVRKSKYRP